MTLICDNYWPCSVKAINKRKIIYWDKIVDWKFRDRNFFAFVTLLLNGLQNMLLLCVHESHWDVKYISYFNFNVKLVEKKLRM